MDAELMRRIEAVRMPLDLAAKDNFAGVRKIQGLGIALRAACDGLIAKAEPNEALVARRERLAGWEQLDETQQQVEVARGMRVMARYPQRQRTVVKTGPTIASLLPAMPHAVASPPTQQSTPTRSPTQSTIPTPTPMPRPSPTPAPTPTRAPTAARSPTQRTTPTRSPTPAPTSTSTPTPSTSSASTRAPTPKLPSADAGSPTPAPTSSTRLTMDARSPTPSPTPTRASTSARSPTPTPTPTATPTRSPTPSPNTVPPATSATTTKTTTTAKTVAAKTTRKPKIDTTIDPLAQPTHTLPGIGLAFAERMAEKGLETVEELLWCLPRRYDDVRDAKQLADVAQMEEGERATFVAKVTTARMVFVRRRRWAEVRLSDLQLRATAVVRWFNVWAGIDKRMPPGSTVAISGVVRKREGRLEFANPDILAIDVPIEVPSDGAEPGDPVGAKPAKPMPKLIARYPEVAGVPASKLRTACQTACARVGASADDG